MTDSSPKDGLQIILQTMRHQSDVQKAGEDWAGVTRTDQRRMLQNRLNQRAYRRKRREKNCSESILAASTCTTTPPEELQSEQNAEYRVATQLQLVQQITSQAYEEYLGHNIRPERLISVLQLNVFDALTGNAAALGLGMLWLVCDAVSPLGQYGFCLAEHSSSQTAMCPKSLIPTASQTSAHHHPWVDVLPWPELRDKILLLSANELIDEDELWYDMVEFDTKKSYDNASLIVWGNPWDPRGWEVSTGFLRKWGWLIKCCPEILDATNYWRARREAFTTRMKRLAWTMVLMKPQQPHLLNMISQETKTNFLPSDVRTFTKIVCSGDADVRPNTHRTGQWYSPPLDYGRLNLVIALKLRITGNPRRFTAVEDIFASEGREAIKYKSKVAMSTQQQSLKDWVTELNDTMFIQPDDEIALKTVHEHVAPSLVVKINHAVYTYDQFLPGLQYARNSATSIQDSFDVILDCEDPEKGDGVVAVLSKWTTKEKASGKETTKTNVILWEVKVVDGKRKLTGQTEVEVEGK
ncbi:hypothetical protein GLAREA_01148 [Glarea lozoyensis ATCC 20868]|uniref:BZIP domain-containing protein n=2 Tax=Glarea lozoyensis TaxID=101852 RepID=S3DU90_GLAL2|nr:uncharacterized protein GLAREA_01148 [Glarea lozoyensis ATCC 20868]EPE29988.1 hypothetical protein GLAREA_01148 [Glarea lozoyensis ATCC 20868]